MLGPLAELYDDIVRFALLTEQQERGEDLDEEDSSDGMLELTADAMLIGRAPSSGCLSKN